jgi:hypothetical protein
VSSATQHVDAAPAIDLLLASTEPAVGSGEVIDRDWLVPRYPPYWHYDVLQALLVLARMGRVRDPRAREAVELVIGLQRDDGLWHGGRSWWRQPGGRGSNVEVVDWGRRGPSQMVTLNALRVLDAAGKLG